MPTLFEIVRDILLTGWDYSTNRIWRLHPELVNEFPKRKLFWSGSYFAASISEGVDTETITAYVRNQGK